MRLLRALVVTLFALGATLAHAQSEALRDAEAAASLPGESVYQLPMDLTDQDGKPVTMAALRGRPVLVTMFYGSCDNVCTLIPLQIRRIERALPAAERARLHVLMVSFDPKRDTPAALRAFADRHRADPSRWVIARAEEAQVRELAAVLGIRYREVADGVFSHSSVITLLDADGMIRATTAELKTLSPEFIRAVTEAAR